MKSQNDKNYQMVTSPKTSSLIPRDSPIKRNNQIIKSEKEEKLINLSNFNKKG